MAKTIPLDEFEREYAKVSDYVKQSALSLILKAADYSFHSKKANEEQKRKVGRLAGQLILIQNSLDTLFLKNNRTYFSSQFRKNFLQR